ncbi:chaplin family protein [Streptomyces sp. NPDC050448]|uniref:chaplin n=1 Tax=Streptomyces sp. NPDC050448 TaxID=3155404 RepID=UPI00342EF4AF
MRQVLSRQVLGKGVLTAAAASSLLSIATGAAYAHSGAMAEASHSPGVLSGNSVSVPITLSPNVCGNSVDGGGALNPSFGNKCATTSGSDAHHADHDRYLSPEHAEAFEHYLEERQGGRHALPEQRREEPRHEESRRQAPRHAAPRYEESRDEGGYGSSDEQGDRSHGGPRGQGGSDEEECDEHPHALPAPAAHHTPPAPERPQPRPHPKPKPEAEHPAPKPVPHPASKPVPVPEAPVAQTPALPQPAPAPVPAPVPLPAPVAKEAPAPAQVSAPTLAETGAGQLGAAAALASALVLGGAILYRRSRIA